MEAKVIQKYDKYSVAQLKSKAQVSFNAWIRRRDSHLMCISCQSAKVEQAGHFYSAGHYNRLRFNEDNCHGQCRRCNYFLSGNLNEYRKNLEKRIGKEKLAALDFEASKKDAYKFDRFTLIDIILKYKKPKP
jgi:hypothetical protein